MRHILVGITLLIVCAAVGSAQDRKVDLVMLTNQGATPGVKALAAAFAQASGHRVSVIQVEGDALAQRINSGAADLVTGNPETIEPFVKNGKVVASTVTPFVLAGLGLSVRAGAPKPDIRTVDAYKAALLAAKSIGYSRGCSGTHIAEGIAQLGLTEQLKARTKFTSGGPVTDYSGARRLRDRHSADQHHGRRPRNGLCRAAAWLPEHAVPVQRRVAVLVEAARRRAGDDCVHDFAGGRAAAPQDARGTGQAGSHLRQMITRCWCAEQAGAQVPPLFCVCRRPLPSGRIRPEVTR